MGTLLTVVQAAERIGVRPRTIQDLARRGELKTVFIGDGRLRRVHEDDLAAFIAERREQAS
jgi:excisionase family DNA binding protein